MARRSDRRMPSVQTSIRGEHLATMLTSTAWLPAASNKGIRYVLMDLLRSGPLSVPTSSLSAAAKDEGSADTSTEAATLRRTKAQSIFQRAPADICRVHSVLLQQAVHCRQAQGDDVLAICAERHRLLLGSTRCQSAMMMHVLYIRAEVFSSLLWQE